MNKQAIENQACIIGFKDKWTMRLGIPILGGIMPFIFFASCKTEPLSHSQLTIVFSILNTFLLWHMDKGIIIYFRKKLPDHSDYAKRLFLQLSIISIATYLALDTILFLLRMLPDTYLPPNTPAWSEILAGAFTITAIVIAFYEAMYFFDLWKIELVENEKLKTENTKAQLDVLKNQVNPHFLFNSFNTLVSIIPEEPEIAVKFTTELSHFYRYILAYKDKELIPLDQELECIDSYIYLLKIRFQDNLIMDKKLDHTYPDHYIVPLSLQILVENAIKHNIISQSKPLIISIFMENDHICIKNNYQAKKETTSTHTGLNNIQNRYQLLVKKEIKIQKSKESFKVCLPLIKAQNL